MTPPASVSPAEKARSKTESLETSATRAKLDFINAAREASPLRVVEQHPLASVTATAAVTMTLTVLATSRLFSPVTVGLFSRGLGFAKTFAKSDLASQFAQSMVAKVTGNAMPGSVAAEKADVNAVG